LHALVKYEMITEASASFSKTIGLTSKLLGIYFNEALHQSGLQITLSQFVILKILSSQDGICQNNLAFITERDKTSLARLINTLEAKKLVKRKKTIEDKRMKKVFISSSGLALLNKASPIISKHQEEAKNNISAEEINNLINVLNKIQANILPKTEHIKNN